MVVSILLFLLFPVVALLSLLAAGRPESLAEPEDD